MTHKLVYTKDYLLVVDDSKIQEGDWMHRNDEQPTFVTPNFWWDFKDKYRKIIAHRPHNGAPFLEGVDVLPPLEDDVEKMAKEYTEKRNYLTEEEQGFIDGYNKAKENLHEILSDFYYYATDGEVCKHETINEFIKSLSQPKMPVAFECEIEYRDMDGGWYKLDENSQSAVDRFGLVELAYGFCPTRIKTITNSSFRTEWVGKYTY